MNKTLKITIKHILKHLRRSNKSDDNIAFKRDYKTIKDERTESDSRFVQNLLKKLGDLVLK